MSVVGIGRTGAVTMPDGVDMALLATWAAARSRSRGLPPPVVDGESIRIDTALPGEERRHIFPRPTPAIAGLAATITRPRILVKLCASVGDLMALLPSGWHAHPQAFFMVHDGAMPATTAALAPGYAVTVTDGPVLAAAVVTPDGAVAARGRAVRHGGLFVYDQIATASAHRRRGLGGHVMRVLEAAGDGGTGLQALTATVAGHALYSSLGWSTLSLYATAEFRDVAASAEAASARSAVLHPCPRLC